MATVTQLKTRLLALLGRAGDTTLDESTWLSHAHREIQRTHNFKCMEVTGTVTLATNDDQYAEPTIDIAAATILAMKEYKITAYTFNTTTSKIVRRYQLTGYDDILDLRFQSQSTHIEPLTEPTTAKFAVYAGNLELWPLPGSAENGLRFRTPGYKFMALPGDAATDWFTINAEDYLLYAAALESVPYLSAPQARTLFWSNRKNTALQQIMTHDALAKHAGPLRARG